MGFSVTATTAILFIALLSAGSAAMGASFDASRHTNEARATWVRTASSQVDTNLTVSVDCPSNTCRTNNAMTIFLRNSGTTVVDMRNLTFVIEGKAHTISNATSWRSYLSSGTPVASTDLILPGETGEVVIQGALAVTSNIAEELVAIQVVTLDGVIGRR